MWPRYTRQKHLIPLSLSPSIPSKEESDGGEADAKGGGFSNPLHLLAADLALDHADEGQLGE